MPAEVEHKLAAILSADVVGYSRLMAEDEAGTIRTVTAYRNEIRDLVGDHRGRVVDAPGDNIPFGRVGPLATADPAEGTASAQSR